MILEELSKHDSKWRSTALKITKGNKDIADDITQEMYLKLLNYEYFTDFLVVLTLRSIYLDRFKKPQNISIEELNYIDSKENTFQVDDNQKEILDNTNLLKWYQKELLKESYDLSIRQIANKYNINYGFVFREIQKSIKKVLGDRYDEYSNSNLKHKR